MVWIVKIYVYIYDVKKKKKEKIICFFEVVFICVIDLGKVKWYKCYYMYLIYFIYWICWFVGVVDNYFIVFCNLNVFCSVLFLFLFVWYVCYLKF